MMSAAGTKNSTIVITHQPAEPTPIEADAVSWSATRMAEMMNMVTPKNPTTRFRGLGDDMVVTTPSPRAPAGPRRLVALPRRNPGS